MPHTSSNTPSTPPQFRAIGPAQLWGPDGPIEKLRYAKAIPLLLLLTVEEPPLSRERAMTLLWPEKELSAQRNNLRVLLSHLRNTLHIPIESDRTHLWLADRYLQQTDFARHRDWSQTDPPIGRPPIAPHESWTLADGLALNDAADFNTWLEQERERFGEQVVRAHKRASEGALNDRQPEVAIDLLAGVVSAAPWDLETHERLIDLLVALNRHQDARMAYERYAADAKRFVDEPPSERVTRLIERLANVEQQDTTLGQTQALPLFGREQELWRATNALEDTATRLVSISGPPGAGSSRVAMEAYQSTVTRLGVLSARASLRGIGDPETAWSIVERELNRGAATQAATTLDEQHPLERISASLAGGATLLWLDDVEPALQQDLERGVARLLKEQPELTVLASGTAPWRHPSGIHVRLGGLQTADDGDHITPPALALLQASIERHGGNATSGVKRLRTLADRLEGNPAALALAGFQIAEFGLDGLERFGDNLAAGLTANSRFLDAHHQSFEAIVRPRLEGLDPVHNDLMAVMASAQGDITAEDLRAILNVTYEECLTRLKWLEDRNLVASSLDARERTRYHAASGVRWWILQRLHANGQRDEVDERMLSWVSQKIHPLARAHGTEERGRLKEWVRDRQRFLSGLIDRTMQTHPTASMTLAADLWRPRAQLGDVEGALEQLERGLASGAENLSATVRSDVLNAIGACRLMLGQPELAEPPFAESLELRLALEDTERIAAAQLNLATIEAQTDRVDDAVARLHEAQDLAAVDDHRWLEGAATLHLANLASHDHVDEKRAYQQKAARLLRETGDLDGEIGAMLGWLTVATETESTQAWEYVTRIGSLVGGHGSLLDARGLQTPIFATADALRLAGLEPLADRLESSLEALQEPL